MKTIRAASFYLLHFLFFFNVPLFAQENIDETVELGTINIVYENFKTVDRAFVLSHIRLSEGGLYNRLLSDQSLRSLYDTNYFEFVDFRITEVNGTSELNIHLTAKYKLKQIEFSGNKNFSAERLLEEGEIQEISILDEYQIDSAVEKMSDLYSGKGYKDTNVSYTISRDTIKGEAAVYVTIEESEKIALKSVSFEGVNAFNPKVLKRVMKTKKKDLFSWLSGSGKFDEELFIDDLDQLRLFYQNAGFLDVIINPELISYDFTKPQSGRITISIVEGEQYFLGEVGIEGASIFTNQELLGLLKLKKKEKVFYSPGVVEAWVKEIEEFYSARGYLETRVFAEKKSNLENRQIDVTFKVKESEKYYLESISIEGNTKTQQKVIIRELALKPGDVFDYKRMQSSEKRLKNTAFFDEVRLRPESTNIPGRKNLNVLVSESRTGSFSFGAGFGSVRSTQLFFEMKQSNFDISDWESGFQGAGQKFRARLSLGSQSSQALIGFEEPWLFEQRLTFGTNLYSTESKYNSVDYNEKRTGLELYVRRRLFELVEAKLSYKYELVDIFDVYSDIFKESEGEQVVSKLGITLLRDNRDSLLFTRRGNRTSIDSEFAGLGGDVNYFKVDFRTAQFIPTVDLWKQSLSVIGRLGFIVPLEDDDQAPFYDRFYLGGPETLRGYDYRDIGPRSTEGLNTETAGGHTYGLFSTEYVFQVSDGFGLVVFYDGGFVNDKENDFSLDNYVDNYGVGARLLMMGSPLKLDYGIPLNGPDYLSNSPQFHFSFGTRY
jgi:outer membrane protein insertion porin family